MGNSRARQIPGTISRMIADILVPFGSAFLSGALALAGSASTNRFTRWNTELVSQRGIIADILVGVRGIALLANRLNNLGRQGVQFHTPLEIRQRLNAPADAFYTHVEGLLQQIVQARLRISDTGTLRALSDLERHMNQLLKWAAKAVDDVTAQTPKMPDTPALEELKTKIDGAAGSLETKAIEHMRVNPPLLWNYFK